MDKTQARQLFEDTLKQIAIFFICCAVAGSVAIVSDAAVEIFAEQTSCEQMKETE